MKPLQDFFSLKQEFSYTILNPIDRCIGQLRTESAGHINFLNNVSYKISSTGENQYYVIARNQKAHLEAKLTSKDKHRTIVHGQVTSTDIFARFLTILVMSVFCIAIVIKTALDVDATSASKGAVTISFVLSLFLLMAIQGGKSSCRQLKQKFLSTISTTELEKKKKHA